LFEKILIAAFFPRAFLSKQSATSFCFDYRLPVFPSFFNSLLYISFNGSFKPIVFKIVRIAFARVGTASIPAGCWYWRPIQLLKPTPL